MPVQNKTISINASSIPAVDPLFRAAEVGYVNFEVVVAGLVDIEVTASSANLGDSEIFLYRKEPDGTLTLIAANDDGVSSFGFSLLNDQNLQAGSYILAVSTFETTSAEALQGINGVQSAAVNAGGSYTVQIRSGTDAAPAGTSIISLSDGEDNFNAFDHTEDGGIIVFFAETLVDDPQGDNLAVVTVRNAAGAALNGPGGPFAVTGGTVVITAAGDVEFTPTPNYVGEYFFTYDVTDGPGGGIITGVQSGYIYDVNGIEDTYNLLEDSGNNVLNVLVNDLNADTDGGEGVLNVTAVTQAVDSNGNQYGLVILNDTNPDTVSWVADPDFFGTLTFTYTVSDGVHSDIVTVTLNVANVDDPYVAEDDGSPGSSFYTFAEDTDFVGDIGEPGDGGNGILSNDQNPDGDDIIVESISPLFDSISGLQVGTVSYSVGDATFTISPIDNYNGDAYFDYVARDTNGTPGVGDDTLEDARVFVTVTPVNDAPVGADRQETIFERTNGNNEPGYVFDDSDFLPDFDDPNDDPADAFSGINVTSLPTNGTLEYQGSTVVIGDIPLFVSVADLNNGDLIFVPDTDENDNTLPDTGYGSFTFQVVDDGGTANPGDDDSSANYTFAFSVTPVNTEPNANDDGVYAVTEDVTLGASASRNLLANDDDGDPEVAQSLTITTGTFTTTANGSITIFSDGTFSYTPAANYVGADSYFYTITDNGGTANGGDNSSGAFVNFNVGAVVDPPVANDDGPFNVTEDVPWQADGLDPSGAGTNERTVDGTGNPNGFFLESQLLGNDTDPDGPLGPNAITGVGAAVNGTVQLFTTNGGFQYVVFTPTPGYSGPASFDYAVTDSTGNSDIGRVSLIIREVSDGGPVAGDDAIAAVEQTWQTVTADQLLGNDTDPDNAGAGAGTDQLFIRAIQNLVNAEIQNVVTDSNGNILSFEVRSTSNVANAPTSFDYVVDDSAARENYAGDTAAPGGLLFNPGNPGSQFGLTNIRTVGAPDTRSGTDIGTVTLNVANVNDAPIADDDSTAAILEDSAGITFNQALLLTGDSDPDNAGGTNAGLTIVEVGGLTPGSGNSVTNSQGTLTANANGTFTFVPAANFNGNATYTYTVTDSSGATDVGVVTIPVTPVNDEPVLGDDGVFPVGLLQPANFFGSTVPGLDGNDPISPGAPLVVEGQSATFTWAQLLANDNDGDPTGSAADQQTLTIVAVNSSFGTVTINAGNQTVTFTPTNGFVGQATFTYTVQDNGGTANGGDDQETATVNVNVVNDEPLSNLADNYNGGAQQSVQVRGLDGNDTITGTAAIDQLYGDGGNDTLSGLGGNDYLYGGGGNNNLDGGDGNDSFYINGGATDTVRGGAGNDAVFAGNSLSVADDIDLGSGINTLAIQGGGYAGGYAFSATNLQNVQNLVVASGQVAGIWPNPVGPGPFDYNLVLQDANIAAGQILTIIGNGLGQGIPGLQAGEDLTLDASDEKNGAIRVFAGQGNDNVIGGEGNDGVFFETGAWTNGGHSFDGRNGNDSIAFRGSGYGNIVLNGVVRVENVVLLSEDQTNFGGQDQNLNTFDYGVTTTDGNTAAGSTLRIDGFFLNSSENLTVNANAELNANLIIFGGAANDTLSGGRQSTPLFGAGGVDLIVGGGGGDAMNGGVAVDGFLVDRSYDGVNVYGYTAASDSVAGDLTLAGIDRIAGFDWTLDKIDVNAGGPATNGLALGIAGLNITDVNTTVGSLDFAANNLANDFNTNLANLIDGILNPNEAAVVRVTGGTLAGSDVFVADINGNGSYDQGTDLVIIFDNPVSQLPPNTDFII